MQCNGLVIVRDPSLKGTAREIESITKRAPWVITTTKLEGEQGTKHKVLKAMGQYSWVHLACHAIQNRKDPTSSHFKLHDGGLELSTIIQESFKHQGLAFLSACQTATGDEQLPEEAVHLAAGMMAAGYSSVLATMWSISDDDAPDVADGVYSRLFAHRTRHPDPTKAAWALHEAVGELRDKVGEKEFTRWVPFIHMGR
jgi:CHAT domain-containing protein